jgi:hypothetical protein
MMTVLSLGMFIWVPFQSMAARLVEYDDPSGSGTVTGATGSGEMMNSGDNNGSGRLIRPYSEQTYSQKFEEEAQRTYGSPTAAPADQRSLRELINEERSKATGGSMEAEFPTGSPQMMDGMPVGDAGMNNGQTRPSVEKKEHLPRSRKPSTHGEHRTTLFSPWKEMRPIDASQTYFN